MFNKMMEMNEKINKCKTGNPETDNIIDLIFKIEYEKDVPKNRSLTKSLREIVKNTNEFVSVDKFIGLGNEIHDSVTRDIIINKFYNYRQLHDVIINNLKKDPNYKYNDFFVNNIYINLISNSRTNSINELHILKEYVGKDLHSALFNYRIDHEIEIDSVDVYVPPKEHLELIKQLPTEYRYKYLAVCKNSDFFKYGNKKIIKITLNNKINQIRNGKVVNIDLLNKYKLILDFFDYPEGEQRRYSNHRDFVSIGLLLLGENFWEFIEKNLDYFVKVMYQDKFKKYTNIELEILKLI